MVFAVTELHTIADNAHNTHRRNTTEAAEVAPLLRTQAPKHIPKHQPLTASVVCTSSTARPSVQPYFIKIFFPMSDSKALPKAGEGRRRNGITWDHMG